MQRTNGFERFERLFGKVNQWNDTINTSRTMNNFQTSYRTSNQKTTNAFEKNVRPSAPFSKSVDWELNQQQNRFLREREMQKKQKERFDINSFIKLAHDSSRFSSYLTPKSIQTFTPVARVASFVLLQTQRSQRREQAPSTSGYQHWNTQFHFGLYYL
eukprot:TRINITY_DN5877_c0_g1_i1.p1 TRINITY_DN5877_c0_g1~~TRINITY_DN5877_c0_g1_i1.p1  ORF type:complete len:158 (-),score=31.00 TRINITY_DN5877_c0_g1_i1:2-475(-)